MRRAAHTLLGLVAVLVWAACAYVLPPSWNAYRAEADDALPAITRAIDERQFVALKWDQEKNRIVTDWVSVHSGVEGTRERFIINWERELRDGTLTVYVRHEAQDQDFDDGAASWGTVYHDTGRERELLQAIGDHLTAIHQSE